MVKRYLFFVIYIVYPSLDDQKALILEFLGPHSTIRKLFAYFDQSQLQLTKSFPGRGVEELAYFIRDGDMESPVLPTVFHKQVQYGQIIGSVLDRYVGLLLNYL